MLFSALDVCVEPVLKLGRALYSNLAQQRGWVVQVPLKSNSQQTEAQLACPIKFSRSTIRYEFVGQRLAEKPKLVEFLKYVNKIVNRSS